MPSNKKIQISSVASNFEMSIAEIKIAEKLIAERMADSKPAKKGSPRFTSLTHNKHALRITRENFINPYHC